MKRLLDFVTTIARPLLGVLFLFSGIVKAIDPLGTVYKITDYLGAFHLSFATPLAIFASFTIFTIEFVIGALLLFNVFKKQAALGSVILLCFFTPLTLYIAYANPVSDCGCFGDAWQISNWETFIKNVIFLPLAFLVWQKSDVRTPVTTYKEWVLFLIPMIFVLSIGIHAVNNRPLVDFRPYHVGVNIPDAMEIPEGAPADEFTTTFIYAKNGEQKEFTEENYPWQDSTWTFVDAQSTLVKKGYEAPIHDFAIESVTDGDITQDILLSEAPVILVVAYQLDKTDKSYWKSLNEMYLKKMTQGINVYLVTATSGNSLTTYQAENNIQMPVCNMDEITLKTMIRSNPGIIVIKEGTIIGKLTAKKLDQIFMSDNLLSSLLSGAESTKNKLILLSLCLLFIGGMMVMKRRK